MAIIVEHDKRRHEILEKSIELFSREGYEDVTFQKIADACGITRTTLYIYFKNKREIFLWSIKQFTSELEKALLVIIKNKGLTPEQCLRDVSESIIQTCLASKPLLQMLMSYLIQVQKGGSDPREKIVRRIIRAEHLLTTIIIKGQKEKVFKVLPVKDVKDMLLRFFEAAIFEIVLYNTNDLENIKATFNIIIDGLLA